MRRSRSWDYQPNPVAQRLAGGQDADDWFCLSTLCPQLSGLEMKFITTTAQLVSEAAYTFMMVTSPVADLAGLRRMIAGGVADGYILMQGWADDPRIPLLQEANLPFVMVGGPLEMRMCRLWMWTRPSPWISASITSPPAVINRSLTASGI
jgi:DNA-binding LacI/PurR family transcriptional regulator